MDGVIVAAAASKWGGRCRDCGGYINRGDPTFKVAEAGPTTIHGQGPGRWVCRICRLRYGYVGDRKPEEAESQASFDLDTEAGQGDG